MNIQLVYGYDGAYDRLPLRVVGFIEKHCRAVIAAHLYQLRGMGNIQSSHACHDYSFESMRAQLTRSCPAKSRRVQISVKSA